MQTEIRRQSQIHYPHRNIPIKKIRAGKILISESILLDWLQFPKGRIRNVSFDETLATIAIVLEDKEMPEVMEGDALWPITPSYKARYNKRGRIISVKREPLNRRVKC